MFKWIRQSHHKTDPNWNQSDFKAVFALSRAIGDTHFNGKNFYDLKIINLLNMHTSLTFALIYVRLENITTVSQRYMETSHSE